MPCKGTTKNKICEIFYFITFHHFHLPVHFQRIVCHPPDDGQRRIVPYPHFSALVTVDHVEQRTSGILLRRIFHPVIGCVVKVHASRLLQLFQGFLRQHIHSFRIRQLQVISIIRLQETQLTSAFQGFRSHGVTARLPMHITLYAPIHP